MKKKRRHAKFYISILLCAALGFTTAVSFAAQTDVAANETYDAAYSDEYGGTGTAAAEDDDSGTADAAAPDETGSDEGGTDSGNQNNINTDDDSRDDTESEELTLADADGDEPDQTDSGDSTEDDEATGDDESGSEEDAADSGSQGLVQNSEHDVSWYENPADTTRRNFVISNADQLQGFAYIINSGVTFFSKATVSLSADIDLTGIDWTPVGFSEAYSFRGTFSGAGYTITGLSVSENGTYAGLFGYLSGTVENLKLSDAGISSGNTSGSTTMTGAVAGYSTGDINDVTASVTVEAAAASEGSTAYIGGIVGYTSGSVSALDVSVSMKVSGTSDAAKTYAGGAVGYTSGDVSELDASGTINAADAPDSGAAYIGGAVGYIEASSDLDDDSAVSGMTGSVAITFSDADCGGEVVIGGLAGETANVDRLLNLGNTGSISASSRENVYAGGLAGRTDASETLNSFNQGTVDISSSGGTAFAGGFFGEMKDGSLWNCYNSNKNIDGSTKYEGYLVGNIDGDGASCEYTYWPGKSTYKDNKVICGTGSSAALQAAANCMGIGSIKSTNPLCKRLNTRVLNRLSAAEDESPDYHGELYMWSVNGGADTDPPTFRSEALYPVYPTLPDMTAAQTEVPLHAATVDETGVSTEMPETAELSVTVSNADSSVTMTYQWQVSGDGETYENITDATGTSYTVTAGEPGEMYYRLRVSCRADYADAPKAVYSDAIKVTTGWRVSFEVGGLADGSAVETDVKLPDGIFPVIQSSGTLSLEKASGDGLYFLGWTEAYEQGIAVSADALKTEYDPAAIAGDTTLYAVFREAGTMNITLSPGADEVQLREGVTAESLGTAVDEGAEYVIPDGNDYFVYDGYRFMGWTLTGAMSGDGQESIDETVYNAGDVYTAGNTDIVLTAVWSRIYSISFGTGVNVSGTSVSAVKGDLPEAIEAVEGEEVELPAADGLSYSGYLFKRWKLTYTVAAGVDEAQESTDETETASEPEKTVVYAAAGKTFTMPAADVTAEAQWGKAITISFGKTMGGDESSIAGELPDSIVVAKGTVIEMPECYLERPGYIFKGWYDVDYDVTYEPGTSVSIEWETTYYADWVMEHEVIFVPGTIDGAGSGTISGTDPEKLIVGEGSEITVPENPYTPPDAEEGYYYRFLGWEDNGNVYTAGSKYKVTSDERIIYLSAKWKKTAIWDGKVAESFASGTGTCDDPYIITTAGELAKLAEDVNKEGQTYEDTYFKLGADIDLNRISWTPIGLDEDTPFCGDFNGSGFTISGLSVDSVSNAYVGLFGYVENGDIYDLDLTDVLIDASNSTYNGVHGRNAIYAGAVAGSFFDGELRNCTVEGKIQAVSDTEGICWSAVGGIVGITGNSTISGCENSAIISGRTTFSGGIAGFCAPIRQIKSSSLIGSSNYGAGGASEDFTPVTIEGCINEGDIYNSRKGVAGVGGIAGELLAGEIRSCINEGDLQPESSALVGGIVAIMRGDITDCENHGDVTAKVANAKHSETDGDYLQSGYTMVYYCDFSIRTADAWGESYQAVAAGISAYCDAGKISGCSNDGDISAGDERTVKGNGAAAAIAAAGIGGIIHKCTLSDCLNTGDILIRDTKSITVVIAGFAGGIAANAVSDCNIEYSCSIGNITTTLKSDVGEIGLLCGASDGKTATYSSVSSSSLDIKNSFALEQGRGSSDAGLYCDKYSESVTLVSSSVKSEDEFGSGEVAYLLGYEGVTDGESGIEESGDKVDREAWTQSGAYPELGSPSVIPATADSTGLDGSITLRNAYCDNRESVYVTPDSTVYVTADANDMSQTVLERTDIEDVEGGTWYYTYQDTITDGFNSITVDYEGSGDSEPEILTGKSFAMKACDLALVSAMLDKTTESALISSTFVAKEEEEKEPEPDKGSGSGTGGGHGSGNGKGTGAGSQDGNGDGNGGNGNNPDGNPNGVPGGTGDADAVATNGSLTTSPSLSSTTAVVNSNADIVVNEPVPEVTEPDTSEPAPASEADSGGGGDPDTETVEEPDDVTVFEVVRDTVASSPLASLLLLLLIVIIVAVGGYSRYRRQRM